MLIFNSNQMSEKRRLNLMEMKCLRSICGVTVRDRIRNEEIRKRLGEKVDLLRKVERCALRWFRHVDKRIVKKVYESGVEGSWGRGRPSGVWMDRVRKALNDRWLTSGQAKMTVQDRVECRAFVKRM